jgi:hypothetical protein
VQEFEGRITLSKLCPKSPDATLIDIIEHHHSLVRQLRQPALELVADRFFCVQPVQMQKIYAPIFNSLERIVECALQYCGESAKPLIMKAVTSLKDLIVTGASLLIALPRIHSMTPCGKPFAQYSLAECCVGDSCFCTQLNEDPRRCRAYNPIRKRHVLPPGSGRCQPLCAPEQGIETRVGEHLKRARPVKGSDTWSDVRARG